MDANARIRIAVQGCYHGVGASAVVHRIVNNAYAPGRDHTLGVRHSTLDLDRATDGVSLTLMFSDCSGDTLHASATQPSVDNADIILLVVSCIRADGGVTSAVINRIAARNPYTPIVLVATHADLLVSEQDGAAETVRYNKLADDALAHIVGEKPLVISTPNAESREIVLDQLVQIARTRAQYQAAFEAADRQEYRDDEFLMGVESEFVAILADLVGGWPEADPADLMAAEVVIEDFELRRNLTYGSASWAELRTSVQRYVQSKFFASVNTYYMTFDNPEFVPPSKHVEQAARDASNPKFPPFTEQELAYIDIGTSALPPDASSWFKRMWATRALRPGIAAFMAACAIETPRLPVGATIIVDCVDAGRFKKYCAAASRGDEPDAAEASASAAGDVCESITSAYSMCRVIRTDDAVLMDDAYLRLGEGDMKLPRLVTMQPEGTHVNVISADSDMLLIFLLQHLRWFTADGDSVRWLVSLDASSPSGGAKPWIDIRRLWRNLIDAFDKRFGWVGYPVHLMCLVIMIAGNDFAKSMTTKGGLGSGLERIGAKRVWAAFQSSNASEILGGTRHPLFNTAISHDTLTPTRVDVNETRVVNFIFCIYHKLIFCADPDASYFQSGVYKSAQLRAKHAAKKLKSRLPPDAEIAAYVRRVTWSMYYMVNGPTDRSWLDPLAIDPRTGVSVYGWAFDPEKKRVQLADTTTSTVFRQ